MDIFIVTSKSDIMAKRRGTSIQYSAAGAQAFAKKLKEDRRGSVMFTGTFPNHTDIKITRYVLADEIPLEE